MDYKEQLRQTYLKQNLTIDVGGNPALIPVRVPCFDELVIIDALNFVVHADTFGDDFKVVVNQVIEDAKEDVQDFRLHCQALNGLANIIANRLMYVFGADFEELIYTGKGRNFYKYSFIIGSQEKPLGHICFGGQNDTVLIMITGAGCQFADKGWEYELYNFLDNFAVNPKLTRIDLAHDDFDGNYLNVVDADEAESRGDFMLTNKRPTVQLLGDWKHHAGSGRTLQIGKRENGKVMRIYEKGKQLGDKNSPWCRAELEFGAKSRHLPIEMILRPTEYFVGAYHFTFALIEKARQHKGICGAVFMERVEIVKKENEISLKKALHILKTQMGRYIKAFRKIFGDDKETLDMIQTDKTRNYYPKRLKVSEKFSTNPPTYAHRLDLKQVWAT